MRTRTMRCWPCLALALWVAPGCTGYLYGRDRQPEPTGDGSPSRPFPDAWGASAELGPPTPPAASDSSQTDRIAAPPATQRFDPIVEAALEQARHSPRRQVSVAILLNTSSARAADMLDRVWAALP